ncbi:MAG: hypothetical protein EBU90_06885 [Proteobacteria bacterium]|nr:hypothetical protein [Pseudomonadota bacterium]NBP14027.1 hypothetical protein [bacterium]
MARTAVTYSAPAIRYSAPSYSRSASIQNYRPAFMSVPLRTYLYYNFGKVLPTARQLSSWNLSGGYAPRSTLSNPGLATRMATLDAVNNSRFMGSHKFGPFVPTYNVGALQSFRNWHSTAQSASARDAMAYRNSQPGPIIYKIRPGSQARANRGMSAYPKNNPQNTSGQGLGSYGRYGTPFINTTSSGAINRMR